MSIQNQRTCECPQRDQRSCERESRIAKVLRPSEARLQGIFEGKRDAQGMQYCGCSSCNQAPDDCSGDGMAFELWDGIDQPTSDHQNKRCQGQCRRHIECDRTFDGARLSDCLRHVPPYDGALSS